MSKQQLGYKIELELQRVNDLIDVRIIKGQSYQYEARRHKQLLSQLNHLRQGSQKSWFMSLGTMFF